MHFQVLHIKEGHFFKWLNLGWQIYGLQSPHPHSLLTAGTENPSRSSFLLTLVASASFQHGLWGCLSLFTISKQDVTYLFTMGWTPLNKFKENCQILRLWWEEGKRVFLT